MHKVHFIYVVKYVFVFISKLGINSAACMKGIDETCWNNRLLLLSNCYEVVTMVATSGRYGYAIVRSYIKMNEAVSQWPLTFNLCVSVTWPLTCAFHIPSTYTREIIDVHRGVCDKFIKPFHSHLVQP